MLGQSGLDFEGGDIDAADFEHVIAAARIGVAAVGVLDILVTALDPDALEGFIRFGAVAPIHQRCAGALDVKVADFARRYRLTVLVAQLDAVARHWPAGAAVAYLARTIRQEDMQHFGRADAVDDVNAEMLGEALAQIGGQGLAGRGAQA